MLRNTLSWEFTARPSPLGRGYQLRLTYTLKQSPEVIVITPDLVELAGGTKLPHVYSETPVRLCLFLPGAREWRPSFTLVETIVAWAYLWLFWFEDWLATGEWKGGGVHPGEPHERARQTTSHRDRWWRHQGRAARRIPRQH